MKRFLLVCLLLLSVGIVQGQVLGQLYYWSDSIAVDATGFDSTFTYEWNQVIIYSDTLDLWLKVGAPDYGDWESRDWMKLSSGRAKTFGPAGKLKRLACKTVTGSGYVYIEGYKTRRQY